MRVTLTDCDVTRVTESTAQFGSVVHRLFYLTVSRTSQAVAQPHPPGACSAQAQGPDAPVASRHVISHVTNVFVPVQLYTPKT